MLEGCTPWPDELAEQYRKEGYWEETPLGEVFQSCVERYSKREAMIYEDERTTYMELDIRVNKLACHLLDLGINPLDRFVMQLPNRPDFVYLYFALVRIGAIPVMALPPHRQTEIHHFIKKTDAVGYAVPQEYRGYDYLSMAREMTQEHHHLEHVLVSGNSVPDEFLSLREVPEPQHTKEDVAEVSDNLDPYEPIVFQLSGGTTGVPKIIPRTHNDYVYNSRGFSKVHGMNENTVLLVVLPVAHNFALASPGVQGCLFNGGRIVFSESPRAQDALPLLEQEQVTHLELVPALLITWLDDELIDNTDLSTVEVLNTGGQKFQPKLKRRTNRKFSNATIQEVFGMAEGLLTSPRLNDPEQILMQTVGRPMSPADEVKLVDDEGKEVEEGEIGEMICQGPYTFRGYYKSPEHNQESFTENGFFKSGDLMRWHSTGNLIIEGRVKDQINRGGEKISAEEVENLIIGHPDVKNVACVPYSDPVLGERMCACVVLNTERDGMELEELCQYLEQQQIAKFKLPERLEIVKEIPVVSGFNKVDKTKLRDYVEQQIERES